MWKTGNAFGRNVLWFHEPDFCCCCCGFNFRLEQLFFLYLLIFILAYIVINCKLNTVKWSIDLLIIDCFQIQMEILKNVLRTLFCTLSFSAFYSLISFFSLLFWVAKKCCPKDNLNQTKWPSCYWISAYGRPIE